MGWTNVSYFTLGPDGTKSTGTVWPATERARQPGMRHGRALVGYSHRQAEATWSTPIAFSTHYPPMCDTFPTGDGPLRQPTRAKENSPPIHRWVEISLRDESRQGRQSAFVPDGTFPCRNAIPTDKSAGYSLLPGWADAARAALVRRYRRMCMPANSLIRSIWPFGLPLQLRRCERRVLPVDRGENFKKHLAHHPSDRSAVALKLLFIAVLLNQNDYLV